MASKKQRRIQMLAAGGVLMAAAVGLMVFAFDETIAFFKSPSEVLAAPQRPDQLLRLGGLVAEGSLERGRGETVIFDVTDGGATVTVAYTGILPDLFREGQGVVAEGYFREGRFDALEVLAKHDENYMPKEVADALREQGHWKEDPGS